MPTDQLTAHTADLVQHQRSIDYVRWLSCLFENDGLPFAAGKTFALRFPHAVHRELVQKAAVAAGTTTDATWAAPLAAIQPLAEAFLAYSRPLSLLGKIQGLRRVPFNVSLPALSAPTTAGWVGQGAPKAISAASLATVVLTMAKAVGTVVVTDELIRLAAPESEVALRQELAAAIAAFLDAQFVDPAVAAVATVNPASVTNAVTPITPSGTTGAALAKDMATLIAQFVGNNPNTTAAALLMTPAIATMLVGQTNSQTLTINGGSYCGIPCVVSGGVGTRIVALDAASILYADAGVAIDMSRHATIQVDAAPDNPAVAATIETSLWQNNLVGLRAERFINWKKAKATAASLISPTAYVAGS